jgi:hypothetical protein
MSTEISRFINFLRKTAVSKRVFNPWKEMDALNDMRPSCPATRRRQLRRYLDTRRGTARYALIGEALGFQGGHFTGIPMTSERILLGHCRDRGISPGHVLPGLLPKRTSRPELKPAGFSEPTATIVWGTMLGLRIPANRFVLWNAFAWHPYDPSKGLLSNRKPTRAELMSGIPALRGFLSLFEGARIVAVGKTASRQLDLLDIPHRVVRHPARGGAGDFRSALRDIVRGRRTRWREIRAQR